MRSLPARLLILLLSLVALSACSSSDDNGDKVTRLAQVKFINASTDLGAVDIAIDTTRVATSLAYGQTTEYRGLTSGAKTILVRKTGSRTVLREFELAVKDGDVYTIALTGGDKDDDNEDNDDLNPFLLSDRFNTTTSRQFAVRVVNLSEKFPLVDAYIDEAGSDIEDESPEIGALRFEQSSDYLIFDKTDRDIRFTFTGTKRTVIELLDRDFAAGSVNTIYLLDAGDGSIAASAIIVQDQTRDTN